jgi:hypothetical protein
MISLYTDFSYPVEIVKRPGNPALLSGQLGMPTPLAGNLNEGPLPTSGQAVRGNRQTAAIRSEGWEELSGIRVHDFLAAFQWPLVPGQNFFAPFM